ncbi:dihydroxyacetone kinase subunit DhaL [Schaalia naturae]|uniref:Dihydroxyacetone kinase subunit DhaL n=1 Tax=Schaalia naturae TaxID=635203 RepID=A0ABW2SMM3_9ACTO
MALDAAWARAWMAGVGRSMADNRERLIDLDRQIGDGDHGENMDRGFAAVEKALSADDAPDTAAGILKTVARTLMSTVGGAAGPLYGTAFLRASKAAPAGAFSAHDVHDVLAAALGGIQARGKAERGDKTMVDAWIPAVEAAGIQAEAGSSPEEALNAAARAAEEGAAATEPLQARKGRASYLGERSIGHLDPGAVSTSLILAQAAEAARAREADPS